MKGLSHSMLMSKWEIWEVFSLEAMKVYIDVADFAASYS